MIFFIITHSWPEFRNKPIEPALNTNMHSQDASHYLLVGFEIQTQFLVGAMNYLVEAKASSAYAEKTLDSIIGEMESAPAQSLVALDPPARLLLAEYSTYIYFQKLHPSAKFQQIKDLQKKLREKLGELSQEERGVFDILQAMDFELNDGKLLLSDENENLLGGVLGWFGQIHTSQAAAIDRASYIFMAVVDVVIVFCVMLFLSGLCWAIVLLLFFLRKTSFADRQNGAASSPLFETFSLYLAFMFGGGSLISLVYKKDTSLVTHAAVILSSLSVISWLLLNKVRPTQVISSLGLKPLGGWTKIFKEFAIGVVGYLMALPFFGISIVITAVIVAILKIDPSTSAHPIFPMLMQKKNPETLLIVAMLAVIMAPLVEEIMFRGCLYSWFRSWTGRIGAILMSSILFASIHPQGAIAILILATVGAALAFLREWRGSIYASMIMHACVNAGTLVMAYFLFYN